MPALDLYKKRNPQNYLARLNSKFDKYSSKERQIIRHYIRKYYLLTNKDDVFIHWDYLLKVDIGFIMKHLEISKNKKYLKNGYIWKILSQFLFINNIDNYINIYFYNFPSII